MMNTQNYQQQTHEFRSLSTKVRTLLGKSSETTMKMPDKIYEPPSMRSLAAQARVTSVSCPAECDTRVTRRKLAAWGLLLGTFFCVVQLLWILGFPASAQAQSPSSFALSITPPVADITMKPGKTVIFAFTIQNDGTQDLSITPVLQTLRAGPSGEPVLDRTIPAPPYITLQNLDHTFGQPFILGAGKKDQLVLRIQPPENEPEGDRYVSLVLGASVPGQNVGATNSQARAAIVSHVLLTVSKDRTRHAFLQLTSFKVPQIIDVFQPLLLQGMVKNSGVNMAVVQGKVQLRWLLTGSVVHVFPLLPENVLSGSNRVLLGAIPDPEQAKSSLPTELSFHPPLLLGPYRVELELGADAQTPIQRSETVWALPLTPALAGLVCLVIFLVVKKLRKRDVLEEKSS